MRTISTLWWNIDNHNTISSISPPKDTCVYTFLSAADDYGEAGNVGEKRISEIGTNLGDPQSHVKFHASDVGCPIGLISKVGKKYVGEVR